MSWDRDLSRVKFLVSEAREKVVTFGPGKAALIFISLASLFWFASSRGADQQKTIFKREGIPDFKNASILGNPAQNVLNGEERLFSKQQKALIETQTQLKAEVEQLRAVIQNGGGAKPNELVGPQPPSVVPPGTIQAAQPPSLPVTNPIKLAAPTEDYPHQTMSDQTRSTQASPTFSLSGIRKSHEGKMGASMISFPVKTTGAIYLKKPSVTLPTGSYVKAKLLTGVEAPEGKTYPTLLQLDFAFIIPNQKRLDLAGCFMIAKAQGDLSTERVQMQATKLSCVSKRGGMFEREVNGFVADDKDNSFAVIGNVNTKQDRVAAMAFLSGIVSGIGKAIQQAQTTQQVTPLGGSQSVVTGDQAKFIAAGGASEAATMVTQWYLKQAQNLLPTINIGSGQDVWVVLQDQVDLPKDYFTQNSAGGSNDVSIYSYFTKLVD